jgi:hypothetical protein
VSKRVAGIPAAITLPGHADRTVCSAATARPARRRRATLIVSALACLCSTAAVAQWSARSTASLGRGYGNIALSQSILSGTRRLGSSAPGRSAPARSQAARPASLTPAQIDAALTYTPDPQQSDRIRAVMITALSEQTPAARPAIEKAFAEDAMLKEFERAMSEEGYSSHNVADDMATLLVVSWETFTGGTASKPQIRGAHQQVRDIFIGTPALRAMTNAERQDMAERIAYQVVISSVAVQEASRSGDQAKLAQLRQSAATMLLQQVGIDITRLRLTERGFTRKS